MKLEYIKANGDYYSPQEAGVEVEGGSYSYYKPCYIKKLLFGRWQIDYIQSFGDYCSLHDKPDKRLILYPSGIEQIRYTKA